MSGFDRLAPFIQDFIWKNRWTELRDVQERAIEAVLDSPDHLIIAAGTASGKTEAAFFPILTELCAAPPRSFGALYVGPLKALINDQFARISALIEAAGIPIYAWHGDRAEGEKTRAQQAPRGVLQITPESLEGLLMRHADEARRMFADLKYVVIDELHAFIGADRGLQLQCELVRIDRMLGREVRRVGLSATISDYAAAEAWLAAGTARQVTLIESGAAGRQLDIGLRWYGTPMPDGRAPQAAIAEDLYRMVRGKKALVFTNSRLEAERVAAALRRVALKKGEPDVFHAHHGSVSALVRSDAEAALKRDDRPAVAVATKTLELGIDLGGLDLVAQFGSPGSCASFVQRLGRSGRRNGRSVMRFLLRPGTGETGEEIPWTLIETIAIVQLYLEERWVEPFEQKKYPFSLLFHQLLVSLMREEAPSRELAKRVHTLPAFRDIPAEDYMTLLRAMLKGDLIEKAENGALIPGMAGEKLAGHWSFLSVFSEQLGCRVFHDREELGEVGGRPKPGEIYLLAGRKWRVTQVNERQRTAYAVPAQGRPKNSWTGGAAPRADRVAQRMRRVLTEAQVDRYLSPHAADALRNARVGAGQYRLDALTTRLEGGRFLLHPWLGTRKMDTLTFLLREVLGKALGVRSVNSVWDGLALEIAAEEAPAAFLRRFKETLRELTAEDLIPYAPAEPRDRYDEYVPEALLKKAYVYDALDLDGVKAFFARKDPFAEEKERKDMYSRLILFTDIGDTIIDEGTEVRDVPGGVVRTAGCIPGARETMLRLYDEGLTIAMVADGLAQSFANTTGQNGLAHIFAARAISELVGADKPDARMFQTAMDALGLTDADKRRVVMIGNNLERDIVGAKRFGIRSILLKWSPRYRHEPQSEEETPDYVIERPEELPALLKKLAAELD